MHVLFVTAFASLVIYLNFTKCKANCIFEMHCINKPRANNEIKVALSLPSFESGLSEKFFHLKLLHILDTQVEMVLHHDQ